MQQKTVAYLSSMPYAGWYELIFGWQYHGRVLTFHAIHFFLESPHVFTQCRVPMDTILVSISG